MGIDAVYIIVNKCYKGGRRFCQFFSQRWAYAYLKSRGTNIPSYNEIKFYGKPEMRIAEGAKVSIGKSFICRSGLGNAIDNSSGTVISVQKDASLTIGEYSGISNTAIHCHKSITIGNHVNIGAGTMIFDTNFHSTDWQYRANRATDCCNAKAASIAIGDFVFIGTRCIICKGVHIGEKSMIAAGSVVVKDIPAGELWGGNPARFIKKIIE